MILELFQMFFRTLGFPLTTLKHVLQKVVIACLLLPYLWTEQQRINGIGQKFFPPHSFHYEMNRLLQSLCSAVCDKRVPLLLFVMTVMRNFKSMLHALLRSRFLFCLFSNEIIPSAAVSCAFFPQRGGHDGSTTRNTAVFEMQSSRFHR